MKVQKIPIFMSTKIGEGQEAVRDACITSLQQNTTDYVLYKNDKDSPFNDHPLNEYLVSIRDGDAPFGVITCCANIFRPQWLHYVKEAMARSTVGIASVQSRSSETAPITLSLIPINNRVNGSCFAVKKELVERIGLFDQTHLCSDLDYWLRAIHAGYEVLTLCETYIYHKGFEVMNKIDDDLAARVEEGRVYFKKKWEGKETYGIL